MTTTPAPKGADIEQHEESDFEAWWESDGQFIRAGGGKYEKSFAYQAWMRRAEGSSTSTSQGAASPVVKVEQLDDERTRTTYRLCTCGGNSGAAPGDALDAGKCAGCKHWNREEDREGYTLGLGRCGNVPMFWDSTGWDRITGDREFLDEHKDTKAFAQDASDYSAYILTRGDFGCVSFSAIAASTTHEAKPKPIPFCVMLHSDGTMTDLTQAMAKCSCQACNPHMVGRMMFICPKCGDKRCPHAANHESKCSAGTTQGDA